MQEESILRHLRESASYSGKQSRGPAFAFMATAEPKELSACSLIDAFVFLFQQVDFFRDFIEDTQYYERLCTAAQQQSDMQFLLPTVAVFNLMADTFHSTGERSPSASEFFTLMQDRADTGIQQLVRLVRLVAQSFRYFCLLAREAPSPDLIVRKFQQWSSSLESGRAFLPQEFLRALAGDLGEGLEEVCKAIEAQNLAKLRSWLEALEAQEGRGVQLARYFYLEEVGRGTHVASELLDDLRDWHAVPQASQLRLSFGRESPGLGELVVPLYGDKLEFRRLDLRGNGHFGFMDLSRLEYTTQKNSIMIDVLYPNRRTARLAIEKYKVDLLKDFVLKTGGLFQDAKYFKRPRFRDLLQKINEAKDSHDLLNDYDIAIFFEKEAQHCHKTYLWFLSVDERVSELVEQASTGIPRVKAYCLDNRRLVAHDAVKVVYSIKPYSFNEESSSFMLYLPEDNEETVADFVEFLLKTHFPAAQAEANAHQLRKDVFDALEFSFLSNLTFETDPALLSAKTGLALTMTFLDLTAALRCLCPELAGEILPEGPQRDLVINCYFARSLIERYGEGRFATDPIENNLKIKLEAAAHLTDVVDYLIHNHQFTSKDRPAQILYGRQAHPELRALPVAALLPSVIVVCVSRINNSLEFSAPFEFACLPREECQQLAVNRSYQLTSMICRKKQASTASPLVFYPVCRVPQSKNDEMIGYMPKEGRAPLSKFKKEQIDYVILTRAPYSYFA